MSYLLDTNHAVALLNSERRVLDRLAELRVAAVEISITTVTLAELYYGAYASRDVDQNLDRIRNYVLPSFRIYDFESGAAEEFGKMRAELRTKGRPIPVADCQIAAIARLHDLTVVTSDRHFAEIGGLRVEDWFAGREKTSQ